MAGSTEKKLGGSHKPKSKSKSKSKKRVKHMHIEKTDNGGFIARHEMEQDPDAEPGQGPDTETHALGDNNALLQHVQDTMGGQLQPQGAAGPGAGAAPQGGAPAGPGGM